MVEVEIKTPLVSVVMPCLNEEEALPICVEKIYDVFRKNNIDGEIVVCDNGSTDRSVSIAESLGVHLVHQPRRGYGNAYLKGFAEARGKYIVMIDADNTYDFYQIPKFIEKLDKEHNDFVMGSRYLSDGNTNITFLHRWVGNPVLTMLLNLFFGSKYTDVCCGFRAFTREAYERIQPVCPGMEFALELAANAHLANLKIVEIPISLAPRIGTSKLQTFKDGWHHLMMLLIYAPNTTFLIPGGALFATGMVLHFLLLFGLVNTDFYILIGMVAIIFSVIGFQILNLGLYAKTYSWSRRFASTNKMVKGFESIFTLERGLVGGFLLLGLGLISLFASWWSRESFSSLERIPIAITLIIIGMTTIFSSLFIASMSMTKTTD
jgi:glycosyltransferase involved in cell wall biosynthesis